MSSGIRQTKWSRDIKKEMELQGIKVEGITVSKKGHYHWECSYKGVTFKIVTAFSTSDKKCAKKNITKILLKYKREIDEAQHADISEPAPSGV